ncbi:MAG TPA: HemK/PrmC family methyltransferase [Acidobacteriaceae bacterium]|jgi:release factor glutamine methyltransferase|nr:HemK/PrmC family methyltransferase [Acidobacteriaceae bacterium]
MTLRDALLEAATQISRRDAETLLAHTLHRDRAWLLAHTDDDLSATDLESLRALTTRRAASEPLQYLTGAQEFFGLTLRVTPDVLIPRPETEHLVEAVLDWARTQPTSNLTIADVGTGSGAIALALAVNLPNATILATDLSPAALAVARANAGVPTDRSSSVGWNAGVPTDGSSSAGWNSGVPTDRSSSAGWNAGVPADRSSSVGWNAERLHLASRIHFLEGDLLAPLESEVARGLRLDVLVSNLPYVAESDALTLAPEVRDHEPHLALFAGRDGLALFRRLIPRAFDALRPGGLLALEIGFGQRDPLTRLLHAWHNVRFLDDYAAIPRVALATRP